MSEPSSEFRAAFDAGAAWATATTERVVREQAVREAWDARATTSGEPPELWWHRDHGVLLPTVADGVDYGWHVLGSATFLDERPRDAVRLAATPPEPEGEAGAVRPAFGQPEARFEWHDEDDQGHDPAVGWDLAFGCQVSIDYDDGALRAVVAMSDASGRGHEVRAVTEEQVRAYATQLLALGTPAPAGPQAEGAGATTGGTS